ncbi:hypothetical protein QWJ26_28970 [Streptomyces sp. CSDS2]|uniref:hypothetical protein n=1 Tax=Streptomyces sp. CSDS2 TaxID=3055051 RepID=UPI0025B038FF|nr:hypothetical protein [Streptomyces sp. CSDS2]MDN3263769.1 hypothetical protein [Streptomyces sp. CSDS2]
MRLRTPLSRCLAAVAAATAATVVLPVPPSAAHVHAQPPAAPSCAAADARTFPLATRIRGGPASYEAGARPRTWYIDLTNTTDRPCAGIHPVVVLVDDERALRPDHPRLDFYDGPRAHRVAFEATDARELVGVLDGSGFAGFTVPPGRTVAVRVRFSLARDAVAGRVTANAAVVQRRGQDGDWVGESGAYRFSVTEDGDGGSEEGAEDTDPVREAREAHALRPTRTPAPSPAARAAPEADRTPLTTVLVPLLTLLAAATGACLLLRARR